MSTVETVRGGVELDALGPTLMHEHVFVMQPEPLQNYGSAWGEPYWDEGVRVADAVAKLQRLRDGGIRTLVDPTVLGLGRNIERIQRINADVDLNIVVASGVYAFLELPNFLSPRSDDAIGGLFVRELTEGINDTGVRAAFLKCAVEHHGLIGDVPRILRIIAAAATETGAPVMVHTNAGARTGLLALGALTEAGVDPSRIVIAHAGDSNDLAYLRAIADTGAWLGFDRFGIEHFNPTADRIRTLLALLAEGYADHIHLSHDAACFYDFMAQNPFFADERPDYLLISQEILPRLREAGVTQDVIDQMMVANPQAFFAPGCGQARLR
jgi:phosphotriesterase-related protein